MPADLADGWLKVRYESAVQIIGFLKRSYGTPVPILRIAQNIRLSYQPTHKHVRALEKAGVIETVKIGREVLCQLRASENTHVWLALLALEEKESLLREGGLLGKLAATARGSITEVPTEGLEALVIQNSAGSERPGVVMLLESYAKDTMLRRFRTRCKGCTDKADIVGFTFAEVAELIADPVERQRWVTSSHPIYGEQRFWEAVLPRDGTPALSETI